MAGPKVLPRVLAAGACAAFLRGTLFATPQTSVENLSLQEVAQRSLHYGCRPVSSTGGSALAGDATLPSIISAKPAREGVPAYYKITLQTPDGEETLECPEDVKILDKALEEGLEVPYSCQSGTCSSCAAQVVSGELDQSEQSFLDDEQMNEEGYCLLCVSYPKSDMTIRTHCEEEL
jgi:ferredoxin